MISEGDTVTSAVLRECREKLVLELDCAKVTSFMIEHGVLPKQFKKPSLKRGNKKLQAETLLTAIQDSGVEEALDLLINHLRTEGTQPHLWTLLEYSKVKHKRLFAAFGTVSEIHHM